MLLCAPAGILGVCMGVTATCAGVPVGVALALGGTLALPPVAAAAAPGVAADPDAAVDDCASPRRTLRSGWYWLGVMSPRARRSSSCLVCLFTKKKMGSSPMSF